MDIATTSKIVISFDTISQAIVVQPSNHKWVTVIEKINAAKWAIPFFVIFAGKFHQSIWYKNLLINWILTLSNNGWMIDQLKIDWFKHFDNYTKSRTKNIYWLLILDGHGSYAMPKFDQYYTNNQIITFCILIYISHLFQPLNVNCFFLFKWTYSQKMQKFAKYGIHHINKKNFLLIYIKIKMSIFIEQTIKNGFLITKLVPADFECVLLSLTVVNHKIPLLFMTLQEATWTSKMLHTIIQLEKQACFIKKLLQH